MHPQGSCEASASTPWELHVLDRTAIKPARDHRGAHDVGRMSDVQLIGHEGARRNAGDRDLGRIDGEGAELVRCVGPEVRQAGPSASAVKSVLRPWARGALTTEVAEEFIVSVTAASPMSRRANGS